ncbi:MAG: hypothetical protein H7306_22795, partial [Bacteriovorax sp.]|nr:hypothetical protein [Rhizobacter sp.]
ALLLETSDQLSLGLLLCSRAEAEHLAGDAATAQRARERAHALATQIEVGADSELGRALAHLHALFEPVRSAV